jgi:nitrogenase molybdenum-iron protein alpha/beta subunit
LIDRKINFQNSASLIGAVIVYRAKDDIESVRKTLKEKHAEFYITRVDLHAIGHRLSSSRGHKSLALTYSRY